MERGRREIWRALLSIALPMMIADSIDSVLWITDTFFVSRLGDAALEAVGLGGYLSWLAFSISSITFMGSMVIISQAWGAGDKRKAQEALSEGITLAVLLGAPVTLGFFQAAPLLVSALAGPEVSPEVKVLATQYFRARIVSTAFSYVGVTVDSAFRATGRTRPIVISGVAYALTNAVLDPILIYGLLGAPRLEVLGAGIASSIANVVFMIVSIALLPRIGLRAGLRRPTRLSMTILLLGIPVFLERIMVVGGHLFYLGLISRCGDPALAAHTIGVRIESLAFLPLFSLSEAVAALSGQEVGRGDASAARRVTIEGAMLGTALGLVVGSLLVGTSSFLPAIFTRDALVIELARIYLLLAAVSEPLFGMAMAYAMGIRGGGNTRLPLIVNLASYYAARVLLGPLLSHMAPKPYCVVLLWLTMVIDFSLRSIIFAMLVDRFYKKLSRRYV